MQVLSLALSKSVADDESGFGEVRLGVGWGCLVGVSGGEECAVCLRTCCSVG